MATTKKRRTGTMGEISDNAGAIGDLVMLIWERKVWWLAPLLIALLLLAALVLLEASPIAPFIYPVF